ncbi:MAG: membrane protein insertase YidC [candidate division Zixibacteria bacterium]|nr:membrane protein insertase YidC [candidate division Zixibacteria bacterium]
MDKKTLHLIILLIVVVIAYWPLMEFLGLNPKPKVEQPLPETADTTLQAVDTSTQTPMPQQEIVAEAPLEIIPEPVIPDTIPIDTITVETNKYHIILSSLGGGPVSIQLKEYFYRDGAPIEMIPEPDGPATEAAFGGGTFTTGKLPFTSSSRGHYVAQSDSVIVTYIYTQPEGGQIVKKLTFYPDEYHFNLEFEVNGREYFGFERQYSLIWHNSLDVTEPNLEMDYQSMEVVAMMSGSREKLGDYKDDRLNQSLAGYTRWAGIRSKYFAAVMIPKNREADGVFGRGFKTKINTPEGKIEKRNLSVGMDMPFANVTTFADTFTIFVGPLDYPLMAEYDVDLEDMLDIGTTPIVGWIIKPFAIAVMWILPRMYDVIPNYGLVIILFALLVKIVTLPLSMKSFKSMNAMKELQPKIEELKKKHKKDPQAMNQEMMKLYKKHGVNPMSGCLPILLQMPLFFALFSVFRSTILLRDAPFVWFITDLSRGASSFTDPYIVLVLLMIGFQFLSQKLTMPSTQQNKALMYIMPLFMGFIFYKFSAGLVLYWACFSAFSLLDYFLFKRNKVKNAEVKTA